MITWMKTGKSTRATGATGALAWPTPASRWWASPGTRPTPTAAGCASAGKSWKKGARTKTCARRLPACPPKPSGSKPPGARAGRARVPLAAAGCAGQSDYPEAEITAVRQHRREPHRAHHAGGHVSRRVRASRTACGTWPAMSGSGRRIITEKEVGWRCGAARGAAM